MTCYGDPQIGIMAIYGNGSDFYAWDHMGITWDMVKHNKRQNCQLGPLAPPI